ncbi:efflux RND transporter periplasmic adaptor subunit [Parasulfuritortus cantonensis]|uniref:efflux RND transporter periplasmic adaptor subunit n=1 Tax=Parasulfuritortus cantonensis TaxID=2528202 RepID=UPI0014043E72|nr:efflux RND transporter periplasmic adaptor subunit [Parasulfuritortus cantonensis]
MKRLALVLAALLGAAALWWWQPWRGADAAPAYRFAKIERGPLAATVSASGTLAASVTVQVGSQVSGQIKELLADYNSAVRQGQVIARLDPASFESRVAQAEADLLAAQGNVEVARGNLLARRAETKKAEVALDDAHRTLVRKQGLVAQNFISTAELDTAQAASDTAREALALARANETVQAAQVQSSQAGVAQKQAALRQAQVDLSHTVIRSPVSGTVISRNVDVGQTVAASLQAPVLFSIAQDLSRMEVNIAVDEADVGRVQVGQAVRFTVDAFPGERFGGRVTQIRKAPQTANNVVTYSVMAAVDNPEQKLLPGMTANASLLTEERQAVLKVANEALRFRPGQGDGSPLKTGIRNREAGPGMPGRVWRLVGGQAVAVPLRLGVSDGKATEILKGDVAEGTEIILGTDEAAGGRRQSRPLGMGH